MTSWSSKIWLCTSYPVWNCFEVFPSGSKYPDRRASGPKYYHINGLLGPKTMLFGSLDPYISFVVVQPKELPKTAFSKVV